jgi:cell wall-associated NlpC family hydrolase
VRYVGVSVATVWTLPTSARRIDAPALRNPADPRGWLAHLTNTQRADLVGRVQTQVLYGTRVLVTETNGAWSHIAIPDQPSQKDERGYPGWVPTAQLTSEAPAPGPVVRISSPAASVGGMELSYGTRLTEVGRRHDDVIVRMLGGRTAAVPSADVASGAARDVLAEARKFIGLPYMWGGTSGFGFDCSGFTLLVYRAAGIALARDTDRQIHDGRPVALRDVAPGDLLFVADASGAVVHEAIYAGSGSIIESPRTGLGVRIAPLSSHRYVAARRVLPG